MSDDNTAINEEEYQACAKTREIARLRSALAASEAAAAEMRRSLTQIRQAVDRIWKLSGCAASSMLSPQEREMKGWLEASGLLLASSSAGKAITEEVERLKAESEAAKSIAQFSAVTSQQLIERLKSQTFRKEQAIAEIERLNVELETLRQSNQVVREWIKEHWPAVNDLRCELIDKHIAEKSPKSALYHSLQGIASIVKDHVASLTPARLQANEMLIGLQEDQIATLTAELARERERLAKAARWHKNDPGVPLYDGDQLLVAMPFQSRYDKNKTVYEYDVVTVSCDSETPARFRTSDGDEWGGDWENVEAFIPLSEFKLPVIVIGAPKGAGNED